MTGRSELGPPASFAGRRVLVTGATGFIGSHLCSALEAVGAQVARVSKRLGTDLTQPQAAEQVIDDFQPQSVFHLASRVMGTRDINQVLPILHDNLTSTVHVLLAAQRHHVKRVICLGSLQEPDQTNGQIANSPYAAAKYAASVYARMFGALYGMPVTIARVFMVYGPGQQDLTKVLPYVISQILAGRAADLSSGQQAFDWVFVTDVVDALLAMHEAPDLGGATIDVGSGALTTVADVVTQAAELLGARDRLHFGVHPDRQGEPTRAADTHRTIQLTGWGARVNLAHGLSDTVAWYRAFRLAAGG